MTAYLVSSLELEADACRVDGLLNQAPLVVVPADAHRSQQQLRASLHLYLWFVVPFYQLAWEVVQAQGHRELLPYIVQIAGSAHEALIDDIDCIREIDVITVGQ